jgi:ORF6N domain
VTSNYKILFLIFKNEVMNELQPILSEESIISKIYLIRAKKVMLDRDLAELYDVATRALNQAVWRNEKRFPEDFMFQLTPEEMKNWKSQIVISNREKMGLRKPPLAFTEQGVAMLSSILNSDRAIMVNIQIIRVFTRMRELLSTHKEILQKLEQIEKKDIEQDDKIMLIFEYLKQLERSKQEELEQHNRPKIGFKHGKQNSQS